MGYKKETEEEKEDDRTKEKKAGSILLFQKKSHIGSLRYSKGFTFVNSRNDFFGVVEASGSYSHKPRHPEVEKDS